MSPKTTSSQAEGEGEEVPKKKFNPWNQEKAEVPNKHLRDQKIAENRGKDNCLAGLTFVITGVLDSMEREECTDLIKGYGGKVTGGVSGKTSYLIAGNDAGESKVKKALEKGTKQIDEDGLFALIKKSGPPSTTTGGGAGGVCPSAGKKAEPKKKAESAPSNSSVNKCGPIISSCSTTPAARGKDMNAKNEARAQHDENLAPSLWVDKYKPNKPDELMGNGDKREQLRRWLATWGAPSQGGPSGAGGGAGGGKQDASFKAILMHGPPGIGKTSSARVVIESCGYTMVELNASDVRNKSGLQEKVASLTQNQSINTLMNKSLVGSQGSKGTCLVMDEVDGMSAGDRGGVQELIQLIKSTRVPIICIANDGYNQKLKSLKNYCLELKFGKPMHTIVVKRLKMIAESEGFVVNNINALEKLYLSSGSDIRHVINALQTWRMRTSELKYDEVSSEISHGEKDSSVRQTRYSIYLL